jgi:acetyl CoA:N6-hydroxylysine acetyl transferase
MDRLRDPGLVPDPAADSCLYRCRPEGRAFTVQADGETLAVHDARHAQRSRWRLRPVDGVLTLACDGPCSGNLDEAELMAVLEVAFLRHPQQAELSLSAALPPAQRAALLAHGLVVERAHGLSVRAAQFWQQPDPWCGAVNPGPYPADYVLTGGRRHPLRPPKPQGTVYRRHIPWLQAELSLRALDAEQDLPIVHRWMNEPAVAHFWQEEGDLERHRAYLTGIAADPHVLPLIAELDRQPFGYFEVYWAKEDRIAPFCDPQDFDRGWHVLIGEPALRGKPFVAAWMPSLSHYLFLDDCRTQRLVIEPRVDNARMLRSLQRSGYALVKEFDFPHKRAMLGVLLRERFFGERLWHPRSPESSGPSSLSRETSQCTSTA